MKLSEATYFPDAKELTRHGFVSHMEDFIGKLIGDSPLSADVDDYLKGFDIDSKKALEMLTKPEIDGVPESAVVMRTERIKNGGTDEFGKPMKDEFQVIYRVPKKDMANGIKGIDEKLRNLYIRLFENHLVKGTILEDDAGDGAFICDAAPSQNAGPGEHGAMGEGEGIFSMPAFKGIVRKKLPSEVRESKKKMKRPIGRLTMFITEEQMEQLAQLIKEEAEMDTRFGNFGYDAPGFKTDKKFFKGATDRKKGGILSRRNPDNQAVGEVNLEEGSGIHIKKKNKGKFTATKKRTGKSTEELTHSKNPLTRKRAIFAQNAKKWHHE